MLVFTPGHIISFVGVMVVWIALIPPFYKVCYERMKYNDPDGIATVIHHPTAFILAASWPLVMIAAFTKSMRRAMTV